MTDIWQDNTPQPIHLELTDERIELRKQDLKLVLEQADAEIVLYALRWVVQCGLMTAEAEQARDLLERVVSGNFR